jgi:hypothetical protein
MYPYQRTFARGGENDHYFAREELPNQNEGKVRTLLQRKTGYQRWYHQALAEGPSQKLHKQKEISPLIRNHFDPAHSAEQIANRAVVSLDQYHQANFAQPRRKHEASIRNHHS